MLYTSAQLYKELYMAAKDQQLEHNIRSIGKSVLVIGGFYALLTIFVLIVVAFDGVTQDAWSLFYGALFTVLLSSFWIAMGLRIRRNAKKPKAALKLIGIVALVSVAYFALNVLETILVGANLGIAITTIFTLYITWSYYDTKSRITGNKKKA